MPAIQFHRRQLLQGAAALTTLCAGLASTAHAAAMPGARELAGEEITLTIGQTIIQVDGRPARAVAINGGVPGPTLRLRQGQKLRITVINELNEDSSIHWHGLELPFQMDGVPGVSFPGIPGSVLNSVYGAAVEHQAAIARTKRSPKRTAN